MKLHGLAEASVLAVAILSAGLGLGCSQGSESSPSGAMASPSDPNPDANLDTFRAGLNERNDVERKYLLTSFLRTMGPEDVQPALALIEAHQARVDAEEVRLLMLAWTRFDGPGAFETASNWPTPWKKTLMEQAMHAWGFHDGRAAFAECEQIKDEKLRRTLVIALMSGWVSSPDLLGASELVATFPEHRRRNRLAHRLADEAMRDGPEAVIEWAEAVPEDAPNHFKATVFHYAAGVIASLDPQIVVPWYESHMKHSYAESALRKIAGNWAMYHDIPALIGWLDSLSLDEDRAIERTESARTAFRMWVAEAPEDVEAWLESASAGPTRDQALRELARATADASPAEAVRLTELIADEELRRKRTLRYTRAWFVRDPDAAAAWMTDADIPEEWRQQILSNLPGGVRLDPAKNAEPAG